MRKIALLGAIFLGLAGTAQAHGFPVGFALLHSTAFGRLADVAQPSCPAGVPVQTITVANQANARPWALAKVENAMVDQSMQLRAAWGTPCVQFGPGGWALTLTTGAPTANPDGSASYDISSHHYYNDGIVSATVQTGGTPYQTWARAFSHEVDESLVDPALTATWKFGRLEICDPVENWTYPVDGVPVSDFALPSYFAGGSGPWDRAQELPGAFQP